MKVNERSTMIDIRHPQSMLRAVSYRFMWLSCLRGRLSNSTERACLVIETPSNITIVVANIEAHSTKARMLVQNPNLTWCNSYRRGLVVERTTHKWPRCDVDATPSSIIRMLVKNDISISWRNQYEKDSDNDSSSLDKRRHVERRSAMEKIT